MTRLMDGIEGVWDLASETAEPPGDDAIGGEAVADATPWDLVGPLRHDRHDRRGDPQHQLSVRFLLRATR